MRRVGAASNLRHGTDSRGVPTGQCALNSALQRANYGHATDNEAARSGNRSSPGTCGVEPVMYGRRSVRACRDGRHDVGVSRVWGTKPTLICVSNLLTW